MFSFKIEDVIESLKRAPNINSAIKSFLKKQTRPGDPSIRFAKDLRDALGSRQPESAVRLIEQGQERFTPHLLAIGAYAYAPLLDEIASKVVTTHADEFNSTYEISERTSGPASTGSPGVKVTNEDKFGSIMKMAVKEIISALEAKDFGESAFMRAVILNAVFEPPVLEAGYDRGLI